MKKQFLLSTALIIIAASPLAHGLNVHKLPDPVFPAGQFRVIATPQQTLIEDAQVKVLVQTSLGNPPLNTTCARRAFEAARTGQSFEIDGYGYAAGPELIMTAVTSCK